MQTRKNFSKRAKRQLKRTRKNQAGGVAINHQESNSNVLAAIRRMASLRMPAKIKYHPDYEEDHTKITERHGLSTYKDFLGKGLGGEKAMTSTADIISKTAARMYPSIQRPSVQTGYMARQRGPKQHYREGYKR